MAGAAWYYARGFFDQAARLNRTYDKCAIKIMSRVLTDSSNCVDVGCYVGQVLERMLKFAPHGTHFAFEPLPDQAAHLRRSFPGVNLFEVALSDMEGTSSFRHVVNRPTYSGLREREYGRDDEKIEVIEVRTARLDDLISADTRIDFIKVDVEGAELGVFRGATRTITTHKPHIVFEHGLGAADYYETRPEDVYDLLVGQCGLKISLMPDWLAGRVPLTRSAFVDEFDEHRNFYFHAHR